MFKFYVDNAGAYIGAFDGAEPPANSIEVPTAPADARQLWDFSSEAWLDSPEVQREQFKAARTQAVAAIKVTTTAGNEFDGDEASQGRMARAVIALQAAGPGATVNWILANNEVIQATASDLLEALALAGAAQAAIWVE